MKLMIEIPEEDYIRLRDEGMFGNVTTFKRAVREGIPLAEQEPCADAISRQAAIDSCLNGWNKGYKEIVEEIRALPPVTPAEGSSEWIPVSERLPEVGSEVLVCYDFKGKRSVYIADFYGDGDFHGLDDEYLTPEGRKYRKAVAWMPLPEPYKASPTGAEKLGHWRIDKDNSRHWDRIRFYCSECGDWQTYGLTKYCPDCGARMEVQDDQRTGN